MGHAHPLRSPGGTLRRGYTHHSGHRTKRDAQVGGFRLAAPLTGWNVPPPRRQTAAAVSDCRASAAAAAPTRPASVPICAGTIVRRWTKDRVA